MTIPEIVANRIRERAAAGLAKYGVGLERTDIDFVGWLRHLQEELLDGAQYIERIIQEYEQLTSNTKIQEGGPGSEA
jgi:hypothetical protein